MITNQRQYKVTGRRLAESDAALRHHDEVGATEGTDPRMHRAMREAIVSEIEELRAQLKRYDDLAKGRVREVHYDSLRDLPIVLIEARIMAGWK